jgi:hypothetical protein
MPTNDDLIEAVQEFFAYVLGDGAKAFETNPTRVMEEHEIPNDPAALLPALETVANQVSFDRNVQQGVNNTSGGGGTPSPPQPDPAKPPVETMKEYVNYYQTNNYETHNFYKDESINTYVEDGAEVDIDRIDNDGGVVVNDSDVHGPVSNVDGDGNVVGEDILKDVTSGQNSPITAGEGNRTRVEDQDVDVALPPSAGPGYGSGVVQVAGGKDNDIDQEAGDDDDEYESPVKPPVKEPIRPAERDEEADTAHLTYEEPEPDSYRDTSDESDLVS